MLKGSLVAIVTPMFEDGSLDFAALRKLVDFHVSQGSDGLVVVGTTGESPTVSVSEHLELIRVVVEQAAGRVPVIAGAGANSTAEAIELSREAKRLGADMTLSVVPYYNRPTQEGMYLHFKAIAAPVDIPMILYNVPGRTVADMSNDTALRLAELPNIVGIKDATGNLERCADLVRRAPPDFALYTGDDATAMAFMLLGGHGVITVTGNVAPKAMHDLCQRSLAGDITGARAINDALMGLHKQLFIEANPIPVKWAVQQMGLIGPGIRLPLTPLSQQCQEAVRQAMQQGGVAFLARC